MDTYIIALIAVALIWYFLSYLKWYGEVYKPMSKLPGMIRIPVLGTKYKFIGVPREKLFTYMLTLLKKYGPIFCTWTGSTAEVHVLKPEYLETVMNNSIHIPKGTNYRFLLPWLGEGLLISKGTKWFQHRKLITPTFHFKILENFMDVFVDKSQVLLKNLDEKAGGKSFDIYQDITLCALDIICETAMGVPVNAMSSKNSQYVDSIYSISEIIIWRTMRPYITDFMFGFTAKGKAFQQHLDVLHNFTNRVIAERKQLLKDKPKEDGNKNAVEDDIVGKKKRMSFLDLLLEASQDGQGLSDTELREEVDTFMFEGHDTTTAGICWSLLLLGNYPDIQEKAFEEIQDVLKDNPTPTSIAELNELKYLERFIKEALRLYPSVPVIIRTLQQEVTMGEYKIPAGVQAVLHIYATHRNADYYPNPEKFDPDRFLPENSKGRHPFAYVPFSAGPRNCIGQKFAMYEEKTILASIIKRFKIKAAVSHQDVVQTADLILRPLNGVILSLQRR